MRFKLPLPLLKGEAVMYTLVPSTDWDNQKGRGSVELEAPPVRLCWGRVGRPELGAINPFLEGYLRISLALCQPLSVFCFKWTTGLLCVANTFIKALLSSHT
jgi:hypothetical protein